MKAVNFKTMFMLLMSMSLAVTACKKEKEEEEEPQPTPAAAAPVTPTISDADAAHWAVRSMSTIDVPFVGPQDMAIGIGVAVYLSETGSSTFVNAGIVKIEGAEMSRYENNAYALMPGVANPNGLDFTNEISWETNGSSAFGSFSHTDNSAWPQFNDITSSTTISKSGYTVTLTSVSNADSVLFMIYDVVKTVSGNATSCTFSADELASVPTGSSLITVAAYRSNSQTINAKNMYFGKEQVRTKSVTITE